MKTQMIIGLVAITMLACSDREDPAPRASSTPVTVSDAEGTVYRTGDCGTNLQIVKVLQAQDALYRTRIILIKTGMLPNAGCDRAHTCIESLEHLISQNLFVIALLAQGC